MKYKRSKLYLRRKRIHFLSGCCPSLQNDNSETLAKRVLKQEHKIYPLALNKLISNF